MFVYEKILGWKKWGKKFLILSPKKCGPNFDTFQTRPPDTLFLTSRHSLYTQQVPIKNLINTFQIPSRQFPTTL